MVSRRKILSRSRDDLTFDDEPTFHKKFEEDTFYSQEKLYKVRKWALDSKRRSEDSEVLQGKKVIFTEKLYI